MMTALLAILYAICAVITLALAMIGCVAVLLAYTLIRAMLESFEKPGRAM